MELYRMVRTGEAVLRDFPDFAVCRRITFDFPNTDEYFAKRDQDAECLVVLASQVVARARRFTPNELRDKAQELEASYPQVADILLDLAAWKEVME